MSLIKPCRECGIACTMASEFAYNSEIPPICKVCAHKPSLRTVEVCPDCGEFYSDCICNDELDAPEWSDYLDPETIERLDKEANALLEEEGICLDCCETDENCICDDPCDECNHENRDCVCFD